MDERLPGGARRADASSQPTFSHSGAIVIDIYVPEGEGTGEARTLADTAEAIFRNAQFEARTSGHIVCQTPELEVIGVHGGFHHERLRVPYERRKIF